MTRRAAELGELLTTCVDLANTARHGPAYALLRTSLEHTFVDELIFRANRMNQVTEGASDEWIEDMRTRIGEASGIQAVERRGKGAVVTRRAHRLIDDRGNQVGWVSPYWHAILHHNPFLGRPAKQADISAVLSSEAKRREWAERNELTYREMLSWGAIKKGLQLNDLRDEATCDRIDVHYRFLGGWTHSSEAALRSTQHGIVSDVPCHYCTELTVLYAVRLAAIELSNVIEHVVGRYPERAEILADLRHEIRMARTASDHLWFPDGRPHAYDRWFAVTCLVDRSHRFGQPTILPDDLSDDQVLYHDHPLNRLVSLHHSVHELATNLSYDSPWPRSDHHH